MKLGIYTDFVNLPDVAGLGFDYVEIPLRELAALPEGDFSAFVDYVEGLGICVGACSDMLPDDLPVTGPNVNATALHGYLKHAFGRAQRLGAKVIALLLQLSNIAVAAHWGHMALASEPLSSLRRAAPLLRHVYAQNALTRALPRPGDGEDYGRLVETLRDIGYTGGLTLSGTITETFAEDARIALNHIRDEE